MTLFLLLVHGLVAALLWGAVTHQALAIVWPTSRAGTGWWKSLRGVRTERYPAAVIVLFCATAFLGAILYPEFRVEVRAAFLDTREPWATGLFEIKEHAAALGLAMLPLYWIAWRDGGTRARLVTTLFLAAVVWFNFVVGHVVNNLQGL